MTKPNVTLENQLIKKADDILFGKPFQMITRQEAIGAAQTGIKNKDYKGAIQQFLVALDAAQGIVRTNLPNEASEVPFTLRDARNFKPTEIKSLPERFQISFLKFIDAASQILLTENQKDKIQKLALNGTKALVDNPSQENLNDQIKKLVDLMKSEGIENPREELDKALIANKEERNIVTAHSIADSAGKVHEVRNLEIGEGYAEPKRIIRVDGQEVNLRNISEKLGDDLGQKITTQIDQAFIFEARKSAAESSSEKYFNENRPEILEDKKLRDNYDRDKAAAEQEIRNYLSEKPAELISSETHRSNARESIEKGDFAQAMVDLESARDARNGIAIIRRPSLNGATPILIRDARNAPSNGAEGIENAETKILAIFSAAIDVVENDKEFDAAKFGAGQLKDIIKQEALKFYDRFEKENSDKNQKRLSEEVNAEMLAVADFLSDLGVKNPEKKLSNAVHFQGLKQEKHYNPVTIAAARDVQGKQHLMIKAGYAFKGLTSEQKKLYEEVIESKSLTPMQKALAEKYKDKVFSGNYTICTQLIDVIPSLRNAFGEGSFFVEDFASQKPENLQLESLDKRRRAGAVASLLKGDDALADEISVANAKAAQIWTDGDGHLNWTSLNTRVAGMDDKEATIVKRSQNALQEAEGNFINSAVNKFRNIATYDVQGVRAVLSSFADAAHDPMIGDFFNPDKKENPKAFAAILENVKGAELDNVAKMITLARELKEHVKKAETAVRFEDEENVSLQITRKLHKLNNLIADVFSDADKTNEADHFFNTEKLAHTQQAIIISCKSGLDRTGLAMALLDKDVFEERLSSINLKNKNDISDALHNAGHHEFVTGSPSLSGGSPGSYKLKPVIRPAAPSEDKVYAKQISGVSAGNNKGPKKPGFFARLKEGFNKFIGDIRDGVAGFFTGDKKSAEEQFTDISQAVTPRGTENLQSRAVNVSADLKPPVAVAESEEPKKAEAQKIAKESIQIKTPEKVIPSGSEKKPELIKAQKSSQHTFTDKELAAALKGAGAIDKTGTSTIDKPGTSISAVKSAESLKSGKFHSIIDNAVGHIQRALQIKTGGEKGGGNQL